MKNVRTAFVIAFGALLLGALPALCFAGSLQPIANTVAMGAVGEMDWGYAWNDTGQNPIRAHGGSILQVGTTSPTYYWYGYGSGLIYYTSTDLSHWNYGGTITLTATSLPAGSGLVSAHVPGSQGSYTGRPRVIYNTTSSNYVMVLNGPQISGSNTVAYFTATSPAGPFTYQNTEEVVNDPAYPDPDGAPGTTTGDLNLFVDGTTAYLISICDLYGQNNGAVRIVKLTSTYLAQSTSASDVLTLACPAQPGQGPSDPREAPCIFKRGSYYYLFASGTTNAGSQTQYATTTGSPLTAWSTGTATAPNWQTVATSPAWGDNYGCQNNMVIAISSGSVTTCVGNSSASTYIAASDRWSQQLGYGSGQTEWDVLSFDSSTIPKPTLNHYDLFYLNAANGTYSTTTYAGPPCIPSNVTAAASGSSVLLTWDPTPGAQTYTIRRNIKPDNGTYTYTTLASGLTASTYTDSTASTGQTYYYIVSAVNSAGESLLTNSSSTTANLPQVEVYLNSFVQPAAPAQPTASPNPYGTAGSIYLTWSAVTGATNYQVARSSISGGPYTVISSSQTTTNFTNTGLVPGVNYYYVVAATILDPSTYTATNSQEYPGWSLPSPESNACVAPTGAQINVTAALLAGNTNVAISWQRDLKSTRFHIFRSTTSGSAGSEISTVDSTSYVDTPTPVGTTYYYEVFGNVDGHDGIALVGQQASVYVP